MHNHIGVFMGVCKLVLTDTQDEPLCNARDTWFVPALIVSAVYLTFQLPNDCLYNSLLYIPTIT